MVIATTKSMKLKQKKIEKSIVRENCFFTEINKIDILLTQLTKKHLKKQMLRIKTKLGHIMKYAEYTKK